MSDHPVDPEFYPELASWEARNVIPGAVAELNYIDYRIVDGGKPIGLIYRRRGERWVARPNSGVITKHGDEPASLVDWLRQQARRKRPLKQSQRRHQGL